LIREYFNERAAVWDSSASETDTGKLERMAARLSLKSGMTVLDIGSGTGVFLPYLLRAVGERGRVIAIDIAVKMLQQARSKKCSGTVDFLCADAMNLPCQPETCDAAVCYSSFPHFHHKLQALEEIRRSLKKGGYMFICHTSSREKINRIHSGIPLLQHHLLPDRTEMELILKEAGFRHVLVEDGAGSYFAVGEKLR